MIMKSIFRKLSNHINENPNLIQATGGNISFKYNRDIMRIKASGKKIIDINKLDGFVDVYYNEIIRQMKRKSNEGIDLDFYKVDNVKSKVSIEVYFHAILDKIVLHTHPVMLNSILASSKAKSLVKSIFKSENFIKYVKPGYELGLEIKNKVAKNLLTKRDNSEFYLQNHGLILSGDNVDVIIKRSEEIEQLSQNFLNSLNNEFKIFNLPKLLGSKEILFLCNNQEINNFLNNVSYIFKKATNPDTVIFCGPKIFNVVPNTIHQDLQFFIKNYNSIPKIFLHNKKFYILAKNHKILNVIEEVLLSHLQITSNVHGKFKPLSIKECKELTSRDDEKYRLNLISK